MAPRVPGVLKPEIGRDDEVIGVLWYPRENQSSSEEGVSQRHEHTADCFSVETMPRSSKPNGRAPPNKRPATNLPHDTAPWRLNARAPRGAPGGRGRGGSPLLWLGGRALLRGKRRHGPSWFHLGPNGGLPGGLGAGGSSSSSVSRFGHRRGERYLGSACHRLLLFLSWCGRSQSGSGGGGGGGGGGSDVLVFRACFEIEQVLGA